MNIDAVAIRKIAGIPVLQRVPVADPGRPTPSADRDVAAIDGNGSGGGRTVQSAADPGRLMSAVSVDRTAVDRDRSRSSLGVISSVGGSCVIGDTAADSRTACKGGGSTGRVSVSIPIVIGVIALHIMTAVGGQIAVFDRQR